jgi:ADP-ribose diphosphatase
LTEILMPDPLEERVVETDVIHRGRYLEFRVETIERADGSRATRDVVGHPGAVAILALDEDGRLLMVRQWRVPAGAALLEIPAGTLEVHDGVTEDPDLCARRELEEETGHRAATWRKLAAFWTAPGFATELMHLYLATGIAGVGAADDRLAPDEDERLELSHVPIDEAVGLVERGEIHDAKSILGILWLDRLRREQAGGGPGSGLPAPGVESGAPEPRPEIRYGYTAWQFALANVRYVQAQRSSLLLGGLFVVLGLINLAIGSDLWIWLGALVLGALIASGVYCLPIALWVVRKQRDVLADLRLSFDDEGIHATWVNGESDIRWAGIEKIWQRGPLLLMKFRGGNAMMMPRRAWRPEQLDAFGRLALRHGLTMDGHRVDVPAQVALD